MNQLARHVWRDHNQVIALWGTVLYLGAIPFPQFHHHLPNREASHAADKKACEHAPYCLPIIPEKIDLLVLDGGEWTSHREFRLLQGRCKVIALDDTNQEKSIKNHHSRADMIESGWQVLADEPEDRNGWFIGRRP